MNDSEALLFPVGYYLGAFEPEASVDMQHWLRLGRTVLTLPEEHFDVWALVHGFPERPEPWTRRAVVAVATKDGRPDADPILDRLLDRGLVVEVPPGTDQAVAFARRYRLHPGRIGVGAPPGDPSFEQVGLPGLSPLRVSKEVFDIWQWGDVWPSIWTGCELRADAAIDSVDGGSTDPLEQLDVFLAAIRTLLEHNAAYLDLAATRSSGLTA